MTLAATVRRTFLTHGLGLTLALVIASASLPFLTSGAATAPTTISGIDLIVSSPGSYYDHAQMRWVMDVTVTNQGNTGFRGFYVIRVLDFDGDVFESIVDYSIGARASETFQISAFCGFSGTLIVDATNVVSEAAERNNRFEVVGQIC